jgi:exopolysaccharide biosynthesis WecB/TagA/CpsF family protein
MYGTARQTRSHRQAALRDRGERSPRSAPRVETAGLEPAPVDARVTILGVPFSPLGFDAATERIRGMLRAGRPHHVVLANAHTLNCARDDGAYRRILQDAALVLRDGVGVEVAAAFAGRRLPHNFVGTDFTPALLERLAQPEVRVFLYGAAPGVATAAASALRARCAGIRVVGTCDGYQRGGDIVALIRAAQPQVLLVALGNPLQEQWIAAHLQATEVLVAIGVGALFDYLAGRVPRAPAWLRRARGEWMYRLAVEPRRLWRRYLTGNAAFLWHVAAAAWSDTRWNSMSLTTPTDAVLAGGGRSTSLEALLEDAGAAGWLPRGDRIVVQLAGRVRSADLVDCARSLVGFLRQRLPKARIDVLDPTGDADEWRAFGARRIEAGRGLGVRGIAVPELRVPELWFQSYSMVTVVAPHPSPAARMAGALEAQAGALHDLGNAHDGAALAYEAHRLAASDLVIACGRTRFGDCASEPWWAVSPSDVLLDHAVAGAAGITPSRLPSVQAVARQERLPELPVAAPRLPRLTGYAAPPLVVALTRFRARLSAAAHGLGRDARMAVHNAGKIPGYVRRRLASRGIA